MPGIAAITFAGARIRFSVCSKNSLEMRKKYRATQRTIRPSRQSTAVSDEGVVFIEAAVGIASLLLLMLLGCDLLVGGYFAVSGQYALDETARWAAFGELLPGNGDRLSSVKNKLRQTAARYGMQLQDSDISICSGLRITAPCSIQSGMLSGSVFTIYLDYSPPLALIPRETVHLRLRSVGQNEPS
jgi:hypothetical protein